MAEAICTGSVFDCLTNHGVEAVTDLWPELTAHEETLQSILNAERCRAAHERAAEREEQVVETLMATPAAQIS